MQPAASTGLARQPIIVAEVLTFSVFLTTNKQLNENFFSSPEDTSHTKQNTLSVMFMQNSAEVFHLTFLLKKSYYEKHLSV